MSNNQIVDDGHKRALEGAAEHLQAFREKVVQEAQEKYTEQLAESGYFRRIYLKHCMKKEIERQVREEKDRVAPPGALYLGE